MQISEPETKRLILRPLRLEDAEQTQLPGRLLTEIREISAEKWKQARKLLII